LRIYRRKISRENYTKSTIDFEHLGLEFPTLGLLLILQTRNILSYCGLLKKGINVQFTILSTHKRISATILAFIYSLSFLSSPFIFAPSANAWTSAQTAVSVFGNTGEDIGRSIAVDTNGNIYTTGTFRGVDTDFDPSTGGTLPLTSNGGNDVFVSKLNSSGNIVWAKSFGGSADEQSYSIAVDGSGNVYTTGYFQGTNVDFDPGNGTTNLTSASVGHSDIFVSKLDSSGNLVWAKSFGGSLNDEGRSIAVDGSGNVYTTGFFEDINVDFDPSAGGILRLSSNGNKDVFVSKLDSSGNLVWAKSFGNRADDFGLSIAVDGSGNVYTTGFFAEENVDFDPSTGGTLPLTSNGANDVFVSKLNSDGNLVWAKSFGKSEDDEGRSIAVDGSGNVYTIGYFAGTNVDFDPSTGGILPLTSAGLGDVFVSKLNSNGNLVWAKSFGGSDDDDGRSIAVDGSGNVYTTGSFKEIADFDPGLGILNLTSSSLDDIFVSKLDTNGILVWAKRIGGNIYETGYSIVGDSSGNVYTTGYFQSTMDFDPSDVVTTYLDSIGSTDVFVLKLTASGDSQTVAAPAFTLSASSESRTVNTTATGFTINSTGGAIASFSINATPPGMSFNTSTGALTGTPNTVASATNYTITATNTSGNATQTFTLTVTTAPVSADNSVAQVVPNAEAARKAREHQELTEILALIPKIGELTLSLGETTKSLYSTKCVKGKSTKFVKKGAKCPKGFVKRK
jgi:Putative Ig domain/Beta-propeller repeat